MADTIDALDFIAGKGPDSVPGVCVVFGDEPFLKRLALTQLREMVLDSDDSEFSLTAASGRDAELRDVVDELSTVSLFGGSRRMVVIDEADDFVSKNRPSLEKYTEKPAAGVLVLEVRTWPKNTRLFKFVAKGGLQIDCAAPKPARLMKWLTSWARDRHSARLEPSAAELLVEIVGPELGLLDQELAKLAVAVDGDEPITAETVHSLVGGWRAKTTWDLLDAAVAGDAASALLQLDRLLAAGEHPVALLGPMGFSLRRFATAARIVQEAQDTGRRVGVSDALKQAGIKPFVLKKAEPQLRQLGRRRALQLHRWLLETDLALKGASQLPPRTVLERLIVKMSKQANPDAAHGATTRA